MSVYCKQTLNSMLPTSGLAGTVPAPPVDLDIRDKLQPQHGVPHEDKEGTSYSEVRGCEGMDI